MNYELDFKKELDVLKQFFALHDTIDYFKDRGNSVFVARLHITKAFDTINHYKLYDSLINSWIPKWILEVVINWYVSFRLL